MANVKANMANLEKLLKSLGEEHFVRVGIIGSKASNQHDSKSGLTNAEIGSFHEFGTEKMEQRSFLEMPLRERLNIKDMKKAIWKSFFVKSKPQQFMAELGAKALDIIEQAFDTNGFGQWKPLTSSTRAAFERKAGIKGWRTGTIAQFRKGLRLSLDRQILTDTGRLRRSISFKVMKRG